MSIPKRLEEIIEEQNTLKEASLFGDIAAVGATALAVGELGLNPVADAAAAGLDAAAVGGVAAEGAGALAGAGEAAAGAGEAASGASKVFQTVKNVAQPAMKALNTVNQVQQLGSMFKPKQQPQPQPQAQQQQPVQSYDLTPQFSTQGPGDPMGTTGFKRVAFQPMTTVPTDDMKWLSPSPSPFKPSAPSPDFLNTALNFALDHPQLTKAVGTGVAKGVSKMFNSATGDTEAPTEAPPTTPHPQRDPHQPRPARPRHPIVPAPSTTPETEPLTLPEPQRTPGSIPDLKTTERTPEDSREVGKETEVEADASGSRSKTPSGVKAPAGPNEPNEPSDEKTKAPAVTPTQPEPPEDHRAPFVPKQEPKGFSVNEPLFQTRGPITPQLASKNRLFDLLQEEHYRTASLSCVGCGATNPASATSCATCDRPVNAKPCTGCGYPNASNASQCTACNTHLGSKQTTWDIVEPTVWY